jgi:high-affinity nickel permease
VALIVDGIEALGLLANHFHVTGFVWTQVKQLNGNFGLLCHCIA